MFFCRIKSECTSILFRSEFFQCFCYVIEGSSVSARACRPSRVLEWSSRDCPDSECTLRRRSVKCIAERWWFTRRRHVQGRGGKLRQFRWVQGRFRLSCIDRRSIVCLLFFTNTLLKKSLFVATSSGQRQASGCVQSCPHHLEKDEHAPVAAVKKVHFLAEQYGEASSAWRGAERLWESHSVSSFQT